MEWTRSHTRAAWTTKHRRQSSAPAITTLRSVVRKQVESSGNKIYKLKLGNGTHTHQRRATRRTNDRAFGDRRVDHSFFTKLIKQSISNFERAAICADVLANHKHGRVAFHLLPDSLANRLNHGGLPAPLRARRFVFFFDGSGHLLLRLQYFRPECRRDDVVVKHSVRRLLAFGHW